MGLGNGNSKHGDKGSNFDYELKNLKGAALTVGLLQSILTTLQDAKEDAEILLVRDEGNSDLIVQQIRIYDTIADTWTTTYALLDGTPYTPTGPLVYLDSSSTLNQVIGQDGVVHPTPNQSGFRILGTDGTTDYQLKVDANGELQVDVVSSALPLGAATEITLAALLTELQLKADLTETQPVSAVTLPLPTGASTSALQTTLNALITTIDGILDAIKLDTANLDVALSTRATEATLLLTNALLTTIDADTSAIALDTAAISANIDASTWDTTIGNTKTFSYYAGTQPGHPATSTTEVRTIAFSDGGGLVFTQTFTYDAANNVLTIVVT